MKSHEAADLFPMMDEPRFEDLVESIREHGLRIPITLCEGKILDGRNRYWACERLALEGVLVGGADGPPAVEYDGDPFAYVWDLNGQRRDLTADQRYLLWKATHEQSEAWLARQKGVQAEGNRKRSEATQTQNRGADGEFQGTGGATSSGTTRPVRSADAKATASNSNRGTVQRMDQLSAARPDLAEKVAMGVLKGAEAMRVMRKGEVENKAGALPEGTYRVFYADPPWSYGNSGAISDSDHYSRVERHYPPMPTNAICALPVTSIAGDDAVLFLWVTSPLLEDGLKVISAWGFKYKSSFVWDKMRHNFGHYNSVRHEFLLVATRGACTPDSDKLEPSIIAIERGAHSEKPAAFRELIDRLYLHGPRVELFARGAPPEPWKGWGNEADAL